MKTLQIRTSCNFAAPWVACASSPCDNEGTCIDVNIDTFICACRDGYYGETCQNSELFVWIDNKMVCNNIIFTTSQLYTTEVYAVDCM